jgi:hypothetical protein
MAVLKFREAVEEAGTGKATNRSTNLIRVSQGIARRRRLDYQASNGYKARQQRQ